MCTHPDRLSRRQQSEASDPKLDEDDRRVLQSDPEDENDGEEKGSDDRDHDLLHGIGEQEYERRMSSTRFVFIEEEVALVRKD